MLVNIHQQLGIQFHIDEVDRMIELGSSDGKKITFEDFYFVMTNQKLEQRDAIKAQGAIYDPEKFEEDDNK